MFLLKLYGIQKKNTYDINDYNAFFNTKCLS